MDRSRPSSAATTFDVEDGYRKKLKETDPHRLEQRQKAIDKGKNTRAYVHYIKTVPKATRPMGTSELEKKYPRTPDKYEIASKRGWDGKIRAWRLRLHQYNPEPKKGEEVIKIPTAIPRDERLGLTSLTQSKKREREPDSVHFTSKRVSHGREGGSDSNSHASSNGDPVNVSTSKEERLDEDQAKTVAANKKVSIFDEWSDGEIDDIGL